MADIWQIKRVGTWAIKYESAQIHFLGEIFSAVADAYAGIESDSHEYGVILARD